MGTDVERFLERFVAFGADPGVRSYLALFHPDATLQDAGMERPLTVPEIPEHIEGILKLVPDFRMTPERWRERGGTLFVEAGNRATLAGSEAHWRSVYCVDLLGDRVVRGRRYYDRRPLYARLDPSLPALPRYTPLETEVSPVSGPPGGAEPLVTAFGDAWAQAGSSPLTRLFREDGTLVGPDLPRPLGRDELGAYHAALRALFVGLRMELLAWAGDDALAFAEWRLSGELGGRPVSIAVADRFDLAGGLILAARAYFDTLELATTLASLRAEEIPA